MEDIKNRLSQLCEQEGISLSEKQLGQFQRYMELLMEWNRKMNLTAITDPEGVTVKHFYDSLLLLKAVELPEGASLIDVGTGAGFPGIPVAIARPDVKLTLLDSLNKRLVFWRKFAGSWAFRRKSVTPGRKKADGRRSCGSSLILPQPERWRA